MLTLIRELQRSQSWGLDPIVSLKTTDTTHLFTRSNFTALCTKLSPKREQLIKNNQCSAKLCNTSQTFNNVWCPSWVCACSAVTICASTLNSKRQLSGLYLGFWTVQFTWAVCFCFRARCVTCCGLTPMTAVGGGSLPEVPATPSVRTSLKPSIMPTDSLWCLAPISWSWR